MNREWTSKDSNQIVRAEHDDQTDAKRVVIVGGDLPQFKVGIDTKDIEKSIKTAITEGFSSQKQQESKQIVVKEIEYREIEKPVIVEKIIYKEIEKPVIIEKVVFKEIEKLVFTEGKVVQQDSSKTFKILTIVQTIAIIALVLSSFIRH
jgi:hypothetical protein